MLTVVMSYWPAANMYRMCKSQLMSKMFLLSSCRLKELSKALYSINVLLATHNTLSVSIPAGKVNDISGNSNLESNKLEVKHCMNMVSSFFFS